MMTIPDCTQTRRHMIKTFELLSFNKRARPGLVNDEKFKIHIERNIKSLQFLGMGITKLKTDTKIQEMFKKSVITISKVGLV